MITITLEGLAIGEKTGNKIADFLIFSAFWVKLFLKTGLNPRELWKYGPDSAFLTAKFGFWNGFLEVRSGLSCTDTVCVVQCTDMSLACVCMAWGKCARLLVVYIPCIVCNVHACALQESPTQSNSKTVCIRWFSQPAASHVHTAILETFKKRILAQQNVQTYFPKKKRINTLKTYYLAALSQPLTSQCCMC